MSIRVFILIFLLAFGTTSCSLSDIQEKLQLEKAIVEQPESPQQISPISRAQERITKKPFGIKISPDDSPIQPERFAGYHTGTDFEIFDNEQDFGSFVNIDIFAICTGPLRVKNSARGYGGYLVQECELEGSVVTVIYGHIKLSSIKAEVDDLLSKGEKIGVLGEGFSIENDGERKHLHLGIHKGKTINILGYVQSQSELEEWVNFEDLL